MQVRSVKPEIAGHTIDGIRVFVVRARPVGGTKTSNKRSRRTRCNSVGKLGRISEAERKRRKARKNQVVFSYGPTTRPGRVRFWY